MLRQNPITKQWVIFSPERAKRPLKAKATCPEQENSSKNCPFCKGPVIAENGPILQKNKDNKWFQFVVPNKYPALHSDKEPTRYRTESGLAIDGFGLAEVIVETNQHFSRLASRPDSEIKELFKTYKTRMIELFKDKRVTQVIVFKNSGSKAGASQPHPHSQIYALPIVPGYIRTETECCRRFYDDEGLCPICHTLEKEQKVGERVIFQNDHVIAICPFAAPIPYSVNIYPQKHVTSLTLIEDQILDSLAICTKRVLKSMEAFLGDFDYNLVFDSAPRDDCDAPFYHLRLRIIPRITTPAGFEIATEMNVNPFLPEKTALEIKQEMEKEER
jgi:UDPglucose--hexose-1-phosphate uridylyltransferase